MNGKELTIGMTEDAAWTVLSQLGEPIRKGKSPQGFTALACNTSDYSEYLLIYLQGGYVVGICGIGKSMSYGDVVADNNISSLSSSWSKLSAYKTKKTSGTVTAMQNKLSSNEQSYVFFDALGDNTIYCIQVFDPTKVKDASNDMIYKTNNLSYDTDTDTDTDITITSFIAIEIGHMLNAFRVYKGVKRFTSYSGLTQCAQNYCNNATSSNLIGRSDLWKDDDTPAPGSIMAAFWECNVNPGLYGEACYTGAADAISFANSLIEMDGFYDSLVDSDYHYIGVGMACNGSHTYVTVDYIDKSY